MCSLNFIKTFGQKNLGSHVFTMKSEAKKYDWGKCIFPKKRVVYVKVKLVASEDSKSHVTWRLLVI